jgi:hypothetical protein
MERSHATRPANGSASARRRPTPTSTSSPTSLLELQRSAGNAAVADLVAQRGVVDWVKSKASAVGAGVKGLAEKVWHKKFADLNATQYRVRADKTVEAVVRAEREDGTVVYLATGEVTGFEGSRPIISKYDPPRSLGNWYPRVSHINGMMVTPESGIGSAKKLKDAIDANLGPEGVALEVDVLYTYSANRGFLKDLLECIQGKMSVRDEATEAQETVMLDAVRNKHRVTVSAHSRGTIKTDNAVRNVHHVLSDEQFATALTSKEAIDAGEAAVREMGDEYESMGISPAILRQIVTREKARQLANTEATRQLDAFVQLIFAGNAVQFPSSLMAGHIVVAGGDPVTIAVGKYFRKATPGNYEMHDVSGGHGFNENYVDTVGKLAAADLLARDDAGGGGKKGSRVKAGAR